MGDGANAQQGGPKYGNLKSADLMQVVDSLLSQCGIEDGKIYKAVVVFSPFFYFDTKKSGYSSNDLKTERFSQVSKKLIENCLLVETKNALMKLFSSFNAKKTNDKKNPNLPANTVVKLNQKSHAKFIALLHKDGRQVDVIVTSANFDDKNMPLIRNENYSNLDSLIVLRMSVFLFEEKYLKPHKVTLEMAFNQEEHYFDRIMANKSIHQELSDLHKKNATNFGDLKNLKDQAADVHATAAEALCKRTANMSLNDGKQESDETTKDKQMKTLNEQIANLNKQIEILSGTKAEFLIESTSTMELVDHGVFNNKEIKQKLDELMGIARNNRGTIYAASAPCMDMNFMKYLDGNIQVNNQAAAAAEEHVAQVITGFYDNDEEGKKVIRKYGKKKSPKLNISEKKRWDENFFHTKFICFVPEDEQQPANLLLTSANFNNYHINFTGQYPTSNLDWVLRVTISKTEFMEKFWKPVNDLEEK